MADAIIEIMEAVMEDQTRSLLQECSSGCKMAINSFNQMRDYVTDEKLKTVIDQYDKKHKELEEEVAKLLKEHNSQEQDPGMMAAMFSRMMTDLKLMMKKEDSQVAKLAMDGCNMGIQSLTEVINKYEYASAQSIALAKSIVKTEEQLVQDLKPFL